MMPQMQEGQPPAWTTYVSVEDAEATAAAVKEAGGTVIAEPMDVMDLGTMAVFADPTGAVFGDLAARHLRRRRARQRARRDRLERAQHPRPRRRQGVLRRRLRLGASDERDGRERAPTRRSMLGESTVGGILDMTARGVPERCPPTGRSTSPSRTPTRRSRRPRQAGGGVMVEPIDIPAGRFAILTDPHGASFAVIALSERDAGERLRARRR